jgi:hypothetical protein
MKHMAPYGFTWLTVEYEPCTGNFEVHGENPLLLGMFDSVDLAGERLELLLAMLEKEVLDHGDELLEAMENKREALGNKGLVPYCDRPMARCPACRITAGDGDNFCRHCGVALPEKMKEAV